jgi:hypothetical protein
MNKGYALEHEIEEILLRLAKQNREVPMPERTFRVPQSGSIRGLKGDIVTNIPFLPFQFLIECKSRRARSKKGPVFRLDSEWLPKLEKEAAEMNKVPLLVFSFKGVKADRIWCCVRKNDYESIFGEKVEVSDTIKKSRKSFIFYHRKLREYSSCDRFLVIKFSTLIKKLERFINAT